MNALIMLMLDDKIHEPHLHEGYRCKFSISFIKFLFFILVSLRCLPRETHLDLMTISIYHRPPHRSVLILSSFFSAHDAGPGQVNRKFSSSIASIVAYNDNQPILSIPGHHLSDDISVHVLISPSHHSKQATTCFRFCLCSCSSCSSYFTPFVISLHSFVLSSQIPGYSFRSEGVVFHHHLKQV
ncbi:hypothetical protein VTN77DRAFT_6314 [Rasamsonia byssochlamydoides]|uniref:uncharacterized protein n=1 Tax=Rasamsonia byssochlamydoides TaxID=89139 RepID=UPI003742D87B